MGVPKVSPKPATAFDIIGRSLKLDDYVVYYNHIYKIISFVGNDSNRAVIFLERPSPTTKKRSVSCNELTLLAEQDVLMWILKRPAGRSALLKK